MPLRSSLRRIWPCTLVWASGCYLATRTQNPFASVDPTAWFFGLVSNLSCVVFDAGKNTLEPLTEYSFDEATGDIVGQPCSDFIANLRRLRTFFQHAVNVENERNCQILQGVVDWYQRQMRRQTRALNMLAVSRMPCSGNGKGLLPVFTNS